MLFISEKYKLMKTKILVQCFLPASQVFYVLSFACHHPGSTSNASLVTSYKISLEGCSFAQVAVCLGCPSSPVYIENISTSLKNRW